MHRLIREDEKTNVASAFFGRHGAHIASCEVAAGEWALVLSCPVCNEWQTFEVDNDARREALRLKGGAELSVSGVDW